MKILLDECVPAGLSKYLVGHECATVPALGFAGMKNGELLSSAEQAGFQVFLTIDQGIAFQQRLSGRRIAILILRPKTNRIADLLPLVPDCLALVSGLQPGELRFVPS